MKYILPKVGKKSFTCPHCNTVSMQTWWSRSWDGYSLSEESANPLWIGTCHNCERSTVWVNENLSYPNYGDAPFPNDDMPEKVLKLYNEASKISSKSPRGAAALLRLGLQLLCKELGEEGKNINSDIAKLVARGLPPMVQKALDSVRVIGNDAVHPGQID